MADIIFSNNATSLLNTSISNSDTTIELAAGFGARFPSPGGSQYFMATLEDDQGNFEVVRCDSRTGDLLTVVRGQDNTTGQAFTQNVTRVELRLVAGVMSSFLQLTGGVMAGNIDMAGNDVVDAVLSGASTQITNGEIVGVPVRGDAGVTTNELDVPTGGGRATLGGSAVLVTGDDIVAELDTAGVIILDSATVGVRIPANAYLRIEGSTTVEYLQLDHDDTDVNLVANNAADLNVSGFTGDIVIAAGIDLDMTGNDILQAVIVDFQFKAQTVSASATTNVDYELGSYVTLDMDQTITNLNITNPPATQYAAVRFKIVQDPTGSWLISNWPAGTTWSGGNPPTLPTAANSVFFVDLWTDDGGTSWYGGFSTAAWS
jgi:hypothetical protein